MAARLSETPGWQEAVEAANHFLAEREAAKAAEEAAETEPAPLRFRIRLRPAVVPVGTAYLMLTLLAFAPIGLEILTALGLSRWWYFAGPLGSFLTMVASFEGE